MLEIMPNTAECFYFWSIDPNWDIIKNHSFTSDYVLLFVLDTLQYNEEYDFYRQARTHNAQVILDIATQNKDKLFIVSTMLDGLVAEINLPNVKLICHGGLQLEYSDTIKLPLILNKDLNSEYTYLSLNRGPRINRVVAASYLLGKNIEKYGYISFDQTKINSINDWLDICNWTLTEKQSADYSKIITSGFQKLKQGAIIHSVTAVDELYKKSLNSNTINFKNYLSKLYEKTFVQIVTETSFCEPSIFATEKFLYSIYGASFPILLAPAGTVNHFRKIGFDMFDDIIDHSYDTILNPLDRLVTAIDSNLELLINSSKTKELWLNCQHRFVKNSDFARENMYTYYSETSLTSLKDILV